MPKRRSPAPSAQLELFGSAIEPSPIAEPVLVHSTAPDGSHAQDAELRARFESLQELGSRVPRNVRFGTSSWSFPGWAGIVYPPGLDESRVRSVSPR